MRRNRPRVSVKRRVETPQEVAIRSMLDAFCARDPALREIDPRYLADVARGSAALILDPATAALPLNPKF